MLTAIIREAECIGCSRCIPACPVDAILGTNKFLHTVLLDECIGCRLCVPVCPVDCIEMAPLADHLPEDTPINKPQRAKKAKLRHQQQLQRHQKQAQAQLPHYASPADELTDIQHTIAVATQKIEKQATQDTDHDFQAYDEKKYL